jgi:protein TonB
MPREAAPIIPPRPVGGLAGNAKPTYPVEARIRHIEGRVLLRVEVSAAGTAASVHIAASSGHPILDRAALAAVETWRFAPATQSGIAVPAAVNVPIDFRMND